VINFDVFNNNSAFIIPFYFKDCSLFNSTKSVDITEGALYYYLIISYTSIDKNLYYKLKSETYFNNFIFSKNKLIECKFVIPKVENFIITPIMKMGFDALSKDDIKKCALFWKYNFYNTIR